MKIFSPPQMLHNLSHIKKRRIVLNKYVSCMVLLWLRELRIRTQQALRAPLSSQPLCSARTKLLCSCQSLSKRLTHYLRLMKDKFKSEKCVDNKYVCMQCLCVVVFVACGFIFGFFFPFASISLALWLVHSSAELESKSLYFQEVQFLCHGMQGLMKLKSTN